MVAVVSRAAVTARETHDAWVRAFIAATSPPAVPRQAPCPNCGHYQIRYQFVADISTRIGFCAVWCDRCAHGHVLSRTKVPQGIAFLPLDSDEDALRSAIPAFRDATLDSPAAESRLSPREAQVLDLVQSGMRTQQIADELHVSRSTINTFKQRIELKLGLRAEPAAV